MILPLNYTRKIKSESGDKNKWINILLSDYALGQYTGQCLQCAAERAQAHVSESKCVIGFLPGH